MNQLRPVALLALALGLALSGCKPAPQAAPADAAAPAPTSTAAATTPAAPAATIAAEAAASCPHPVFDEFLKHFGNEIALQETSTADPLVDSHIDAEAEPEPRKVGKRCRWPRSNGR